MLKNYKLLWALIAALIIAFIFLFVSQKRKEKILIESMNRLNYEMEKMSEDQDYLSEILGILNKSDSLLASKNSVQARDLLLFLKNENVIKSQKLRVLNLFDSILDENSLYHKENFHLHEEKRVFRLDFENKLSQKENIIERLHELLSESRSNTDSLISLLQNFDELPNKDLLLTDILGIMTIINSKGNEIYYIGEKTNGMANGQGAGLWKKGGHYSGEWKDNNRHGEGTYFWADGESYEGGFVMDKREGFGKYIWKSGIYYVGNWKSDKRHGEGELYEKNGKLRLKGVWKDDVFVKNPLKAD